ncbi:MAG: hypothetical protein NC833_01650 [Candidatus Omnitrophica bacterium]|nr:hypothetical protein [Candidatus Omnitrophota bacterium]
MKNYFLVLNDYNRLETLIESLKRKYNIDEFDIKIFDASKLSINEILKRFDILPIFSDRILFVIKNVEEIKKRDCQKLYDFLNNLSSDIIVILYGSSIEEPFEESLLKEEYVTPEVRLFSEIYSLKERDNKKIFEALKEYIKVKERNFTILVSGIEIYLRNIIKREKRLTKEIIKKIEALYNLDYFLKIGKVELGSELEIYLLYYFFSTSN